MVVAYRVKWKLYSVYGTTRYVTIRYSMDDDLALKNLWGDAFMLGRAYCAHGIECIEFVEMWRVNNRGRKR